MRSRTKWKVSCTSTMIVQLIGTKYVQICEYIWSRAHNTSYIKYAGKLSFLWPCPGSEMRSRSKWKACCTSTMIVQLMDTKYVHIYVKRFGPSRAHKVTPVLYKVCRKTKFLRPCPGSEMRWRSKWKVSCTSTMIVQLIGTKYVQLCEKVCAESRTQSITRIQRWTDRQTDGRPTIEGLRAFFKYHLFPSTTHGFLKRWYYNSPK